MMRVLRPWVSLLRGVLLTSALGAGVAFASNSGSGSSGSGSDHEDDFDTSGSDNSGSSDSSDSGSGDFADSSDSSGSDDSDSSGSGDGSGGGDSGDDDSSGSGSGDGSSGSGGSGSGSSGGTGDEGDHHSGNSGHGNSGRGNSSHGNSGHGDSGHGNSGHGNHSEQGVAAAYAAIASSGLEQQTLSVEHDALGGERVAGEALFTGSASALEAARNAGFEFISVRPLASMDAALAHLRVPNDMSVDQAVQVLQALGPEVLVTANNIYRSAEANIVSTRPAAVAPAATPTFVGVIGIIDTGVGAQARGAILSQRAFAGTAPTPREHGSLVAALAIEGGMRVHVADVFRPSDNGGMAASAESIAAALDWMIANNVAVINVSIEGPNNAVLAALVERAVRRGHVIVAAAGNGGPFARPAFPAAFDGSVAVTAIDGADRPYMRANRGDYIAFAAPGVDLNLRHGNTEVVVSGTSFAAPVVAAKIATRLHQPSPANARAVLETLQDEAVDLGVQGRDPIFGWGALRE